MPAWRSPDCPLHPLVVHAAVVLVPLAALSAVGVRACCRGWRWLTRWPTASPSRARASRLAFLATTSAATSAARSRAAASRRLVARRTSERGELLVDLDHRARRRGGGRRSGCCPGPSGLASGRRRTWRAGSRALTQVLPVLLVAVAAVASGPGGAHRRRRRARRLGPARSEPRLQSAGRRPRGWPAAGGTTSTRAGVGAALGDRLVEAALRLALAVRAAARAVVGERRQVGERADQLAGLRRGRARRSGCPGCRRSSRCRRAAAASAPTSRCAGPGRSRR